MSKKLASVLPRLSVESEYHPLDNMYRKEKEIF